MDSNTISIDMTVHEFRNIIEDEFRVILDLGDTNLSQEAGRMFASMRLSLAIVDRIQPLAPCALYPARRRNAYRRSLQPVEYSTHDRRNSTGRRISDHHG